MQSLTALTWYIDACTKLFHLLCFWFTAVLTWQMLRAAISSHTGAKEADWPENIPLAAYGTVNMSEAAPLLSAISRLFPGEGIPSHQPKNMEEYDQGCSLSLVDVTHAYLVYTLATIWKVQRKDACLGHRLIWNVRSHSWNKTALFIN